MSGKGSSGTVLIRENTVLPAGMALESEAFLPGWRLVLGVSAYGLGRSIEEARWNFFCLAGEIRATVFGTRNSGALRRAAKQILSAGKKQKCNSLEFTSVVSKSLLGIPFVSVVANYRHIEESLYLATERAAATRIAAAAAPRIEPERNSVGILNNAKVVDSSRVSGN
jgi:hypothetical protein